jgi:quercetin dioxygenase-like cupin family protein/DNA-binding XRE family transcriptional regulator
MATAPKRPRAGTRTLESHVGEQLRTLRNERGLSLAEVSQATGISTSFLSLVETGRSDITLNRLVALVKFFRTSIEELLPQTPESDHGLVRADTRRTVPSSREGVELSLLSPTDRSMMSMILTLAPEAALAEDGTHDGEEFVHVLAGRLEVTVDGTPTTLEPGDSFIYSAELPHGMRNLSTETTTVFSVVSPPSLGPGPDGGAAAPVTRR